MISDLLLLSGNDIPFYSAQLTIHQPTIKEIGYISEESFFSGCELLNFSKEVLKTEDKTNLEDKSNFEIFMSIMKDKKTLAIQQNRISAMLVLSLIFPKYHISFIGDKMIFKEEDSEDTHYIEEKTFEQFKEILSLMFCLKQTQNNEQNYNPQGSQAAKIAEKLRKGREKVAAARQETKKISILSRYISILTIGEQKDMNELLKLTVYQLFDEFERFELKQAYDVYFQAKLAGAKDIEEVDNWMKDIHS